MIDAAELRIEKLMRISQDTSGSERPQIRSDSRVDASDCRIRASANRMIIVSTLPTIMRLADVD